MSGVNAAPQSANLSRDASIGALPTQDASALGDANAAALSAPETSDSPSLFGWYRNQIAEGVRSDCTLCDQYIFGNSSSIPVKILGGVAKAVVVASGVALRTTLLTSLISKAKEICVSFIGWVIGGGLGAAFHNVLNDTKVQNTLNLCANRITRWVGENVENRSRPYTIAASVLFAVGAIGTEYYDLGSGPADALAGGLITVAAGGAVNFVAQSLDVTSERARPYVIGGATVFTAALAGTVAAVACDYASNLVDAIPYGAATAAVGAIGVLGAYYTPNAYAYFWGQNADLPVIAESSAP